MTRLASRDVLALLLDQHAHLRRLVDTCEALALGFDEERVSAAELAAGLAALRQAFEDHNRFEESVLRPLFAAAGAEGPADVDRMVDDHVREHRAVRSGLAATEPVRDALRAVLRHLSDEEHYFATLHGAADAASPIDVAD